MSPSPTQVTLVASTVSTVDLDAPYAYIEVKSLTGASTISVSAGSIANPSGDPTVNGNGFPVVSAVADARIIVPGVDLASPARVKLISAGTPTVSVRGINRNYMETD